MNQTRELQIDVADNGGTGERRMMSEFQPRILRHEMARRVLAVAITRIEGTWAAYIDAVPGANYDDEMDAVLRHGAKLYEPIARALFPSEPFKSLPYAP